MELKDVILSTLAEMENDESTKKVLKSSINKPIAQVIEKTQKVHIEDKSHETEEFSSESEISFLKSLRERLLVLFEGFQAPNNTKIEAKVDMTLNFLEYVLASLDARVEKIEKRKLK